MENKNTQEYSPGLIHKLNNKQQKQGKKTKQNNP